MTPAAAPPSADGRAAQTVAHRVTGSAPKPDLVLDGEHRHLLRTAA